MLVFVTPHQFMEGIRKRLIGKVRNDAEAISLIKGMEVKKEGPCLISKLITDMLGINCCVLMGANIADEIALEKFSEATVGYRHSKAVAQRWTQLFTTSYFLLSPVQDVEGVELCGTLKNVVAIAAGLVDGMEMGNNTKAAIMRIGLREMRALSKLLFSSVKDSTFFESCGVADLITTCLGGRNRKVARGFCKEWRSKQFKEMAATVGRAIDSFFSTIYYSVRYPTSNHHPGTHNQAYHHSTNQKSADTHYLWTSKEMAKGKPHSLQTVELKVRMCCSGCKRVVKNAIMQLRRMT